jgi:integration host factor subunit alpha
MPSTNFFLTRVYVLNIIKKIKMEIMKQAFVEGESIKISGFGTFNVRQKMARRGRNPKTGNDLEINPRKVISFRGSNQIKSAIEKRDV